MMVHGPINLNWNNRSKKMEDSEVIELAETLDSFFSKTILEKELSVNGFNGVFMARMVRLNQACGNMDNFIKLLCSISEGDLIKETKSIQ